MTEKVSKTDDEWKNQLSPEEYSICRKKNTEPPFTGIYWDCKDRGTYKCTCCGLELFSSDTKFDSGSGWPSFFKGISNDAIKTEQDTSHGMIRTEIMCDACDAHLGHVFDDGPEPTGQRYCVNSLSIQYKEFD